MANVVYSNECLRNEREGRDRRGPKVLGRILGYLKPP